MRTFVEVDEARRIVLESAVAMPAERVTLQEALGRTLAGPITADMDIPPFPNSAMDGYAVRAADLPVPGTELPVSGVVRAGEWPTETMAPGTCWSITTGSPVPAGADTVVPVEETVECDGGLVRFESVHERGRHVRRAGRDVERGDTVIEAGAAITPAAMGILAMVGMAEVPVSRRPTISIVSTGDELVAPTEMPRKGQIRNSNATALVAQASAAGAVVDQVLHARDEEESTRLAMEKGLSSDVLVISGGVSMGTHDIVRGVLEKMGVEWMFWKVRQRPGKPLAFGMMGDRRILGLPGNPVSSSVGFDQYVRPLLLRMQGRHPIWRPRYRAILEGELNKPAGLHVFARGVASAGDGTRLVVRPTGPQGSNLFTSMLLANCLVHLPAEWDAAPPGSVVEIEWLDW